ncbi:MAG: Holliday junction DNA helicase RuvA [Gammaproteobacteria bacterium RIFCSPHIGHO2_12_FULL_41_20]|nr:MAG: Holliday junction DNA helicase RuvA [Gammaproteobacteria bacterium RIFCSPHIGHO2_12_FULL_41_20]
MAPPKLLLGFDFGTRHIGVAIGQTVTQCARPLKTIKAINGLPARETIALLIKQWQPDALVVGIPLNMRGEELSVTSQARHFSLWLHEQFHLPVYEVDERLTTKDAREKLFLSGGYKALQDGQVDSVAAQLILQNWLENIKGGKNTC